MSPSAIFGKFRILCQVPQELCQYWVIQQQNHVISYHYIEILCATRLIYLTQGYKTKFIVVSPPMTEVIVYSDFVII